MRRYSYGSCDDGTTDAGTVEYQLLCIMRLIGRGRYWWYGSDSMLEVILEPTVVVSQAVAANAEG